ARSTKVQVQLCGAVPRRRGIESSCGVAERKRDLARVRPGLDQSFEHQGSFRVLRVGSQIRKQLLDVCARGGGTLATTQLQGLHRLEDLAGGGWAFFWVFGEQARDQLIDLW